MDTERRERREGSEILREQPRAEAQQEQEPVSHASNEHIDAQVAAQRKEAERLARAAREMKDPLLTRIENVLSEGLADEYATLGQKEKQLFKTEGEALAGWLRHAAIQGKVRPHEVLKRMEKWLLIIERKSHAPYWLLQEAYIRARRVLRTMMHEEQGR